MMTNYSMCKIFKCCNHFIGYDKAEVDRLLAEGKLTKEKGDRMSLSQSVSSLDRDDDSSETIKQVTFGKSFLTV